MPSSSSAEFPSDSQFVLLDALVPGFSLFAATWFRYTNVDLSIYIPGLLLIGLFMFAWGYLTTQVNRFVGTHFMSTADVRDDDEICEHYTLK